MDGQCHADADLGLLNCQRGKNLYQPPALMENSRDRIWRVVYGKRGPAVGLGEQVGARGTLVAGGGEVKVVVVLGVSPRPHFCSVLRELLLTSHPNLMAKAEGQEGPEKREGSEP